MKHVVTLIAAALVFAGVHAGEHATKPTPAAFDRIKALEGTWTGKGGEGTETMDAKVVYRVTSGGNAVEETLFPGTPHEMVTMYHPDGNDVVLTHYCAMGNQPTMKLQPSSDPKTLSFDFVGGANVKPSEPHMHSAKITLVDPDHLESAWTSWENGKPGKTMRLSLTRTR